MIPAVRRVRAIAFYLPQYHPIPENDEWWGKGFTEWTNVAKARPLFPGHVQPHIPADLGFYDLRLPETRIAQAEVAKEHGIEGFCYWHYWFAGKRLLERPFNEVLASGEPDFPFCLAWANQSWTGIWHGNPRRMLIEQTYPGKQDYEEHFHALLPAFNDPRYIRVDGKPLFVVYCPNQIPEPQEFIDCWRTLAQQSGLGDVFFVGLHRGDCIPEKIGFDGSMTADAYSTLVGSHVAWRIVNKVLNRTARRLRSFLSPWPRVLNYRDVVDRAFALEPDWSTRFPVVIPNWDNTPRCGRHGFVFLRSSPKLFQIYVRRAVEQLAHRDLEYRLMFVKSWNEWAEGNYLEPDIEFGPGYLEALKTEVAC